MCSVFHSDHPGTTSVLCSQLTSYSENKYQNIFKSSVNEQVGDFMPICCAKKPPVSNEICSHAH